MSAQPPGRVIVAVLGMDQHETGALTAARILRDAGFEVIYLGRFNSPESVVRAALEEAADAIGISTHAWEYLGFLGELQELLRAAGLEIPIVVGGSVLTPRDERELAEQGVAATFGPGSTSEQIVSEMRRLLAARSAG